MPSGAVLAMGAAGAASRGCGEGCGGLAVAVLSCRLGFGAGAVEGAGACPVRCASEPAAAGLGADALMLAELAPDCRTGGTIPWAADTEAGIACDTAAAAGLADDALMWAGAAPDCCTGVDPESGRLTVAAATEAGVASTEAAAAGWGDKSGKSVPTLPDEAADCCTAVTLEDGTDMGTVAGIACDTGVAAWAAVTAVTAGRADALSAGLEAGVSAADVVTWVVAGAEGRAVGTTDLCSAGKLPSALGVTVGSWGEAEDVGNGKDAAGGRAAWGPDGRRGVAGGGTDGLKASLGVDSGREDG